ncbi:hypothetical protein F7731_04705 [Cytobacillus depressus]|uniref:Uncharacterized protein n=1 Tax=Cytobacillus depressus TaxID=1602942 RepID=A0A6L3VII8_9BACI|nr:hypothetical protein [Cytobacillus depressus]KAB2338855.1 hypothetical protein F7731_04705 [Cytobacillus depressus]
MNESMKEKRARFMLIGFFILVTIFAFSSRFDRKSIESDNHPPAALVLEPGIYRTDDPIVALYTYKNNEQILGVYKIESNNDYRFKAIRTVKLINAPYKLAPDKNEKGKKKHSI